MFREKYSQGHYGPFLSIKIPLLRKDTFIATDGMPGTMGPTPCTTSTPPMP